MTDLRRFRDPNGRLLFDVPGGRIPSPRTPVPPRFLPALDNAWLGYKNRDRIVPSALSRFTRPTQDRLRGPILVDGFVAGEWSVKSDESAAVIPVELATDLPAGVYEEALRLVKFLEPDAVSHEVQIRK